MPDPVMTAVRALAVLARLGWLGSRCDATTPRAGRLSAWCWRLGISLIFNPRTETNSYVLLAPFAGLLAGVDGAGWQISKAFSRARGVLALILSCENWGPLHKLTNLWLKAAAGLVFGGFLIRDVLAGRDPLACRRRRTEAGVDSARAGSFFQKLRGLGRHNSEERAEGGGE